MSALKIDDVIIPGLPEDVLKYVGAKSVSLPDDFFVSDLFVCVCMLNCGVCVCVCVRAQKVSRRLERSHIAERLTSLETGVGINWATAEALAIGTLLYQGQ